MLIRLIGSTILVSEVIGKSSVEKHDKALARSHPETKSLICIPIFKLLRVERETAIENKVENKKWAQKPALLTKKKIKNKTEPRNKPNPKYDRLLSKKTHSLKF